MKSFAAVKNKIGFVGGLAAFVLLLLAPLEIDVQAKRTLAVLALCAIWWGTEAISIYATSLVPAVLLPVLGILPLNEALSQYANRLIFLFLGGFLIARSMMKWGIDRRLALGILGRAGGSSKLLVLYFMALTAFLSALISNTATTAMMLPIAIAILASSSLKAESKYGTVLLLGIAYASTIGGVATLVGTPPNVLLAGFSQTLLGREVTFFECLKVGLPYAVVMLPLTWWFLWTTYRPKARTVTSEDAIKEERATLGPLELGGKYTIAAFVLLAVLWLTRPFWDRIPLPIMATIQARFDDSNIALACALLLFVVPTNVRKWEFPLSTPPNAIVYGSGKLEMSDMVRTGFRLHLIGAVVMAVLVYLVTGKMFGVFPA